MRLERLFTDKQYEKYTKSWWEKVLDWILSN